MQTELSTTTILQLFQCFLHSDLDSGRPSTAQFREKLPWFLNALPSADCAKGGHGAYTSSVDLNGMFYCSYMRTLSYDNQSDETIYATCDLVSKLFFWVNSVA